MGLKVWDTCVTRVENYSCQAMMYSICEESILKEALKNIFGDKYKEGLYTPRLFHHKTTITQEGPNSHEMERIYSSKLKSVLLWKAAFQKCKVT